jgi:hypothetical protein
MGDTDFPTVLGDRMTSNPAGYLQQYVKGMEAGGPLIGISEISNPEFNPIEFEISGRPGYMPTEQELHEKVREYYSTTPRGRQIESNIKKLKQRYGGLRGV